jgi:nitronate monooxygenase
VAFPRLDHPIVAAPMAGGPSTPELVAAVSDAGGLGFLPAGYATPDAVTDSIEAIRERTGRPFGLNLFVPSEPEVDAAAVEAYRVRLEPDARRLGVSLGEPRWSDDWFDEKLELVLGARPAVVSTTFGLPGPDAIGAFHERDIAVWATITSPAEAILARDAGVDALIVQGAEAGGHRGAFVDGDEEPVALLPLLRLVAAASDLPLVAAGGIADGAAVAAVLAAGARAAQIGTAFLLSPEAGTSEVQRQALRRTNPTRLTRAFTGRRARGLMNRFVVDHSAAAPAAYPHVHHLTAPLRAQARAAGDAGAVNLWAGQAYRLAESVPAAELVRRWSADARRALTAAEEAL